MTLHRVVIKAIATFLALALALSGCTTAQLQKRYTSFDGCFRDQKVIATAGGALLGAFVGNAIAGRSKNSTGVTVAAAMIGGVIGNRVAWQACLEAFPVRAQTQLVAPPQPRPGQPVPPLAPLPRGLLIQNVTAQPLQFGRDLEVSTVFSFDSGRPGTKDVKARVWRNLLFTAPDGSRQEITSSSEDVIQPGVSRSTFALPTPSMQDAPELSSTKDWAFKFIVEADGFRQEQTIALAVPQLDAPASQRQGSPVTAASAPQQATTGAAAAAVVQSVSLRANTALLNAPNSKTVSARTTTATSASVLRRIVERGVNWMEVRLPDGREGWIRGAAR